jgi:hypothetical protein
LQSKGLTGAPDSVVDVDVDVDVVGGRARGV